MKNLRLALIGENVKNSSSPFLHRFIMEKLGYTIEYTLCSVEKDNFEKEFLQLLKNMDGVNITTPYKGEALKWADSCSSETAIIEATNTVLRKEGKIFAYNTDGQGFIDSLKQGNISLGKRAAVIGCGGAGRSVAYALKKEGVEVFLYRRNSEELKRICDKLGMKEYHGEMCDLLINASGVGRGATRGISPLSEEKISSCLAAIDLIYNPLETKFLLLAKKQGKKILNGKAMLFFQAYYSDCLYLGILPEAKQAENFYKEYAKEKNL